MARLLGPLSLRASTSIAVEESHSEDPVSSAPELHVSPALGIIKGRTGDLVCEQREPQGQVRIWENIFHTPA